jgi:hypothetical protein
MLSAYGNIHHALKMLSNSSYTGFGNGFEPYRSQGFRDLAAQRGEDVLTAFITRFSSPCAFYATPNQLPDL